MIVHIVYNPIGAWNDCVQAVFLEEDMEAARDFVEDHKWKEGTGEYEQEYEYEIVTFKIKNT